MKLKSYIQTFPHGQRTLVSQQIAKAAGVGVSAVRHWCYGRRKIPARHMRAIEKVTQGQVTCYDMLPDESIDNDR